jgi:hypothetical protein
MGIQTSHHQSLLACAIRTLLLQLLALPHCAYSARSAWQDAVESGLPRERHDGRHCARATHKTVASVTTASAKPFFLFRTALLRCFSYCPTIPLGSAGSTTVIRTGLCVCGCNESSCKQSEMKMDAV